MGLGLTRLHANMVGGKALALDSVLIDNGPGSRGFSLAFADLVFLVILQSMQYNVSYDA